MTYDKKDKAIVKASALVGYCQSAPDLLRAGTPELEQWIIRLQQYAEGAGQAISAVYSEPARYEGIESRWKY